MFKRGRELPFVAQLASQLFHKVGWPFAFFLKQTYRYMKMPFAPFLAASLVLIWAMTVAIMQTVFAAEVADTPTGYENEVVRLNRNVKTRTSLALAQPNSWLRLEQVAKAHLNRARLTGNFDDYVAAQAALDKAFSIVGESGGPVLTRALHNFSTHQLAAIEADLVAAESALLIDAQTRSTIAGVRGDVLFYTGQYAKAEDVFNQQEAINSSVISATRLAHYSAHIGNFEQAERWLQTAETRVVGESLHLRSWLKLQLGLLDLQRGRLDNALADYNEGISLFPGFWLLEEHVAEIDVLQGREKIAELNYRDLIERTGSPEFMTALADILASRPNKADQAESVVWLDRVNMEYNRRIELMPALVAGHALEYYLQSGDANRALELARYNYQLRPGGQASLLLVQAHMATGQLELALPQLDLLLQTPFKSAELHATAGIVFRATGALRQAAEQDSLARAINPFAVDDIEWLQSASLAMQTSQSSTASDDSIND